MIARIHHIARLIEIERQGVLVVVIARIQHIARLIEIEGEGGMEW